GDDAADVVHDVLHSSDWWRVRKSGRAGAGAWLPVAVPAWRPGGAAAGDVPAGPGRRDGRGLRSAAVRPGGPSRAGSGRTLLGPFRVAFASSPGRVRPGA